MPTPDGWEREAQNWIAWTRTPGHDAYPHHFPAFRDLLPAPGAGTLEIGCGEGRVARDLASLGHDVTGIDAAPSLVRAARQAHPAGRYLVADATELPFADGSFDLVVAYNSLMDMARMPSAVREAARVLSAHGRLCVCVTHPTADAGRFVDRSAQAPFQITGSYLQDRVPEYAGVPVTRDGISMTFHSLRYSLQEYSQALEVAGLVIEALREPSIPEAVADRDPSRQRWRRLPNLLMIRAVRAADHDRAGRQPAAPVRWDAAGYQKAMDTDQAQTFIDALRALETDGDPDALVAMFDADAVLDNVTSTDGMRGTDGARQFWTQDRALFTDVESDFRGVYADGETIVLEWRRTGTGRDGGTVNYDGVSVVEYRNGQIVRFKAYYDPNRLGQQAL